MKKLIVTTIILSAFLSCNQSTLATDIAGSSAVLRNDLWENQAPDPRVKKLEGFFEKYNSPLTGYATCFIQAADRNQIDWKLVPAITGVESTFGKHIPYKSYNAYGWANGDYRFTSWEQSINHVSQVLKEKYVDRGLDTPYKIAPVYAPPSSTWGGKVAYFMKQIESFNELNTFENINLTL